MQPRRRFRMPGLPAVEARERVCLTRRLGDGYEWLGRLTVAAGFSAGRPDIMLAHDPFDPLATDGLALGAQFGVDARRSVSFLVLGMDPPDVD